MAEKAGKGFRFLEPNEIINTGDEYDWGGAWIPVKKQAIGVPLYAKNFKHYRRPGKPAKGKKLATKPINYQRLALRMSKAASIREARKIYADRNGKKALDHKREEEG